MQQFLGIDFGTSAVRAVVIDEQCRVIVSAKSELPPPCREGRHVTDAPERWWQQLCGLLDQLTLQTPLNQLCAIAVDGTSATVLASDENGQPLSSALMYSDSRAIDEARVIASIAPDTSGALGPSSSLAKLLYLYRQLSSGTFRYLQHQADWILARLSGQPGITDENHALKLGYDALARTWPDWLTDLGIPRHLFPAVVPAGSRIGTLQASLARRWKLPGNVAIVTGTTDSTAAFIAAGAEEIGDAVTSLGSTLVIKVLSDRPVFSPGNGVYSHRLNDRWLVGGASNTGGAVLRQFFDDETLHALSRQIDPRYPVCLEYYPLPGTGERFPINDPTLEPRMSPRPRDERRFLQGLLQAIARIEQQGYRLLESLSAPYPARVFTVGGGAANTTWNAIRAQYLRRDIIVAQHQEAAYGSALLARQGFSTSAD